MNVYQSLLNKSFSFHDELQQSFSEARLVDAGLSERVAVPENELALSGINERLQSLHSRLINDRNGKVCIRSHLDDLKAALSQWPTLSATRDSAQLEKLEFAALSNSIFSLYIGSIRYLIEMSYSISEWLDYWKSFSGSPFHVWLYGIQVAPGTAFRLVYEGQILGHARNFSPYSLFRPSALRTNLKSQIRCKKQKLYDFKQLLACFLGLLFEHQPYPQVPRSKCNGEEIRICLSTCLVVLREASEKISRQFSLNLGSNAEHANGRMPRSTSQQVAESADLLMTLEKRSLSNNQLLDLLNETIDSVQILDFAFTERSVELKKPGRLTRNWPILVGGLLLYWRTSSWIFSHRLQIISVIFDVRDTLQDFLIDWVIEPIRNIYKTIRKESDLKLTAGTSGLSSDLESLERMVCQYALDEKLLSEEDIETVIAHVRQGDLSIVLRDYENSLRTPIKSAVYGNMIRSMLIQVQKAKVDLEFAMHALDKLLSSNELNFAFLAVAPSLIVLGAAFGYFNSWLRAESYSSRLRQKRLLRRCRDIERELTRNLTSAQMPYASTGQLIIQIQSILHLSADGSLSVERSRLLQEDVADLIDPDLSPLQKLETVRRLSKIFH